MGCKNTDINNIETFRGDDLAWQLNFNDTNGDPIDITGWTIFFTMKDDRDDSDSEAVYQKTETMPSGSSEGTLLFTVPGEDVNTLVGPYYYDFQFINASGGVNTITRGSISFDKDITRRTA